MRLLSFQCFLLLILSWGILPVSAHLQSMNINRTSGVFTQKIDAKPYRGKAFKLQAAVKVVDTGEADKDKPPKVQLWARVDRVDKSEGKRGFFYNMDDRPIYASDWGTYSFEGVIDQEADLLFFGGIISNFGEFFIDAFQLSIQKEDGRWAALPITNPTFDGPVDESGRPRGWGGSIWGVDNIDIGHSPKEGYSGRQVLRIHCKRPKSDLFENQSVFERIFERHSMNVYVNCMIQDRLGLLWIGTTVGLYQFDGNQLVRYYRNPFDENSLSGNMVFSVCEGKGDVIWVGTDYGLNKLDRKSGKITQFIHDPKDSLSLSHNLVQAVCEDHLGVLWAGTIEGGLNRLDPGSSQFKIYRHDPEDSTSLLNNQIRAIFEDSKGRLWIGNNMRGGVHLFDRETDQFKRIPVGKDGLVSGWIFAMDEDANGNLWVATVYGLNKIDGESGDITQYIFPPNAYYSSSMLVSIKVTQDGVIWLGTGNNGSGLLRYNPANGELKRYVHDKDNHRSLSDNVIASILEDKEKNIWVGTGGGLDVLKTNLDLFEIIQREEDQPDPLSSNYIVSVFEDKDSNLWLGTGSEGLNRLDLKEGKRRFINYRYERGKKNWLGANYLGQMMEDSQNNLWFTYRTSIKSADITKWNLETNQITNIDLPLERAFVFYLLEDRDQNIWVGSLMGLNKMEKDSDQFSFYPIKQDSLCRSPSNYSTLLCNVVSAILEDHQGTIWVGTSKSGLARFDKVTGEFTYFGVDSEDPRKIKAKEIACIYEDKSRRFWIGAFNEGLYRFDKEEENFYHFTPQDGIDANSVYSILEDENGIMWFGTSSGLYRYDVERDFFLNYKKSDGLPSNEFNLLAGHKSQNSGKFYFGTTGGLISFHPDSVKVNSYKPPVVITSLRLFNADQTEGTGRPVPGISLKKKIKLSYKDDLLVFDFAALSFQNSSKNHYAYRLEGAENRWIDLGTDHSLMLSNLNPGKYSLHIRGSNGDGIWNEEGTSLNILITPPWYWAWWSKSFYIFLILAGLYQFYRFQLNRRLMAAEAYRLRELDEVKTRFYTNITHEFRTPLTIILGMVDKMKENPRQWFSEGVSMIKHNGHQLLSLINQILDLRKLESGRLKLQPVQADILPYLKYHLEAFHTYAEDRDIRLHFITEEEEIPMDFAPKEVQHIMNNLVFNAIKYNREGGDVYLRVSRCGDCLEILVEDNGIGIPEDQLIHIFDRFYQVQSSEHQKLARAGQGTGIGLALTKELVKLMDGSITVKSKEGEGTIFKVLLPIQQMHPFVPSSELGVLAYTSRLSSSPTAKVEAATGLESRPLVLIVEDNKDVIYYLQTCLQAKFQLEIAYNGAEGIEKALEQVPDLIISDVMMPEKDGYELCATLKQDTRTSHIPIILLTAKGDLNSKLEGLQQGADAYLPKPFQEEELLVRMEQMIQLRKRLREKYSDPGKKHETSIDDVETQFLGRLQKIVLTNIDSENFGIKELCRAMHLSRTQLHRKLKSLTGKSTSIVIREIRLQKAKELLIMTDLSISEVAYEVGFTNSSYFTQMFVDTYGVPPSDFKWNYINSKGDVL